MFPAAAKASGRTIGDLAAQSVAIARECIAGGIHQALDFAPAMTVPPKPGTAGELAQITPAPLRLVHCGVHDLAER